MAFNIGNVQLTNTFDYWRQRTNDIVAALNGQVVAVGANTVSGNAVVNGTVQAVILVANSIGGSGTVGATGAVGAAANLSFTTNTVFLAPTFHTNANANNFIASDGNGTITANSTAIKLFTAGGNTTIIAPTAAMVAGGNYYLNANGQYTQVSVPTGVAGTNTQIQFNDSGTLAGSTGLTFNKTSNTLNISTLSANSSGLYISGTLFLSPASFTGTAGDATHFNGQLPAYYTDIPSRLGYTPVQQGTGTGQSTSNVLKIGWANTVNGASTLRLMVDTTDYGPSWPINVNGTANNASYLGGTVSTSYLLASTAASTYQTQSAMSSYLTTSTASSTYQTQSAMSSYLTTSAAASTYVTGSSPTFTGTVYINGAYKTKIVGLGTTSSVAMDCSQGNYFTCTASGASTASFSNVPTSVLFSVTLKLINGGASTFTWPGSVKWPAATAPTLTASGTDYLNFVTDDGGTTWSGMIVRKDSR